MPPKRPRQPQSVNEYHEDYQEANPKEELWDTRTLGQCMGYLTEQGVRALLKLLLGLPWIWSYALTGGTAKVYDIGSGLGHVVLQLAQDSGLGASSIAGVEVDEARVTFCRAYAAEHLTPDQRVRCSFTRADAATVDWKREQASHVYCYDAVWRDAVVRAVAKGVVESEHTQVVVTCQPVLWRKAMGFKTDLTYEREFNVGDEDFR